MCDFLSAIVFKGGRIICQPELTDSHSDLIAANNLRDDNIHIRVWVRVELTPTEHKYLDVDSYSMRLDESSRPDWFDSAAEFDAAEKLRDKIRAMIVTDKRALLLGGCWILGEGADIESAKAARIVAMISSAKVGEMRGSSQVGEMRGSSQVGVLRGSSQVGEMRGSSQVGEMRGSSQVGEMWGSSQVGEMRGSSQVGEMWENSQVGVLRENSQVGVLRENSQVVNDFRIKPEAK
jgi:hypothetical protein